MLAARMLGPCLTLACLACLAGCQRPTNLNPVSGKVSFKGETLHGGVIVFTPDTSRGESGRVAIGTIRDDGSYQLNTGDTSGASAGWYRVTASAPGGLLPDKYRSPEESLLRCEIKDNRPNNIDFNLE